MPFKLSTSNVHQVKSKMIPNVLLPWQYYRFQVSLPRTKHLYFSPHEKWQVVTSNFNQNILGMKDLSKNKVPFLLTFKGLSNKQTIFYFIGTLTITLSLMIVQLIFEAVFFLFWKYYLKEKMRIAKGVNFYEKKFLCVCAILWTSINDPTQINPPTHKK